MTGYEEREGMGVMDSNSFSTSPVSSDLNPLIIFYGKTETKYSIFDRKMGYPPHSLVKYSMIGFP